MADESQSVDLSVLNHGFFQLTLPHRWYEMLAWLVAVIIYISSGFMLLASFSIPDVPPISESQFVDSLEEIDQNESVKLGAGWDNGDEAVFAVMEVEILNGTLVHGYSIEDGEGNCSKRKQFYTNPIYVQPLNGDNPFSISWFAKFEPDVSTEWRECGGEDWYINDGDIIKMFIVGVEGDYWMLSVGAEGKEPSDRLERESSQRGALFLVILASILMMVTTPSSLSSDLKKLRKGRKGRELVHGKPGELKNSKGMVREPDESDWVLAAPDFKTWSDNPYAADDSGELILEHPSRVGTPNPATFTLYSINGLIFIITSIWLSIDLTARHNIPGADPTGLRLMVVLYSTVWAAFAFRKWKLIHNIIDTPTSKVSSVAAGPAELVGQVRPGPQGTISVDLTHGRNLDGVVYYTLKEEKRTVTTDGDGNQTESWVVTRHEAGMTDFILHDGTGGILVDVDSWGKKVDVGENLSYTWFHKNYRWSFKGLAAGDPVYCIGKAEIRTEKELEEGLDRSIPSSLLVVRGNKDVGTAAKIQRGTELSLISGLRSTTEAIVIPVLMMVVSIIPFIW